MADRMFLLITVLKSVIFISKRYLRYKQSFIVKSKQPLQHGEVVFSGLDFSIRVTIIR